MNDTAKTPATGQHPIKIILITGYLGAGKTTLLNRLLANDHGLRIAVIVNDIGEVNVDASLIGEGGLAEDVIPLTNGCICCTLSEDLASQLAGIAGSGRFDYIAIEASGICEPIPIAYTISDFCSQLQGVIDAGQTTLSPMVLDNIVAVVDCARMIQEFDSGQRLVSGNVEEDDVECLLIQQMEFCSTLVLNKTDLVTPDQLAAVKRIARTLQKDAVFVEAQHGKVPLGELLNTGRFSFQEAYESAVWLNPEEHAESTAHKRESNHGHTHAHECEGGDSHEGHRHQDHDHDHSHEHGRSHMHSHDREHNHSHGHARSHNHDHDHDNGHDHSHDHVAEFGFSTFLYERRVPFDMEKLAEFARTWPAEIVRSKGVMWCTNDLNTRYLFEQAGQQVSLTEMGSFVAALPAEEQKQALASNPTLAESWDEQCGDRITRLCIIGHRMDRATVEAALDTCLAN